MSAPETALGDIKEEGKLYLEMVQSIIARLNTNSFLIKGWSITIASGFIAMAVATKMPKAALFGIPPTVIFWLLDSYYLSLERRYRHLFDRVFSAETAKRSLLTFDHSTVATEHQVIPTAITIHLLFYYSGIATALALCNKAI